MSWLKQRRKKMKIKRGVEVGSSDFWYDLTDGGYIKPEEILENPEDIKKVQEAIQIVKDFQDSCEEQIEGFIQ